MFARLARVPRHTWVLVAIGASVVVADQISKYQAVAHLTYAFDPATYGETELGFGDRLSIFLWNRSPARAEPVAVLDDFWHFSYAENPGAAWSFLRDSPDWFRTPFFAGIAIAAMVFIVFYLRRTEPSQRMVRVALALVFGGALGNLLDRVRLTYVIDFIDWHWYNGPRWPTFNVADSAISVGVALLVLDMIINRKKTS